MTDKLAHLLSHNIIKNKKRINWDQYFMSMAILRSSCHRLNVGCVLVRDKHVISMGYNGFLPNSKHESIVINKQNAICCKQRCISKR